MEHLIYLLQNGVLVTHLMGPTPCTVLVSPDPGTGKTTSIKRAQTSTGNPALVYDLNIHNLQLDKQIGKTTGILLK